jgi:hypothetical protein
MPFLAFNRLEERLVFLHLPCIELICFLRAYLTTPFHIRRRSFCNWQIGSSIKLGTNI